MNAKNIHRIRIWNRYFKITRFYDFIKKITLKTGLLLTVIVALYLILHQLFPDAETVFHTLVSKFSLLVIFTLFFTSEFFMGLIPPEFFIAWTFSTFNPWFHVFLLSTLSYIVGILAYFFGIKLFSFNSVKCYLETKVSNHIKNLKRWGGVFIFVGAMLPIPFSMVSLASGLINFRIQHYLLWSLFRYVRFFLYAIVVFKLM
ncbi:MAG: YqaA family protein [bacterium]